MKAFSARRRRLLAVMAGGLAGAVASRLVAAGTHDSAAEALAARLADFYTAGDSAAEIGREYLRDRPHEADWDTVTNRLLNTDLPGLADAVPSPAQIDASVRAQVRADFADGRIVEVCGWALSQTEARLCALAALR